MNGKKRIKLESSDGIFGQKYGAGGGRGIKNILIRGVRTGRDLSVRDLSVRDKKNQHIITHYTIFVDLWLPKNSSHSESLQAPPNYI
jgi:hypothetical protein